MSRFFIFAITLLLLTGPVHAQLVGDDTEPGDSCATYPAGASLFTADDGNTGKQITLICDGSTWQVSGTVVQSLTGDPPFTAASNIFVLNTNSSEPVACNAGRAGSLALTSTYRLCVCNAASWIEVNNGSACTW